VLNEADLRRVQLALRRLGYYAGPVDGRFGPESLVAVRRFQHELGTEMTGRLTAEQVARLLQDSR
jgi:peptidoglycan hydrolase-like protein with peptidoglycan-binding domain